MTKLSVELLTFADMICTDAAVLELNYKLAAIWLR